MILRVKLQMKSEIRYKSQSRDQFSDNLYTQFVQENQDHENGMSLVLTPGAKYNINLLSTFMLCRQRLTRSARAIYRNEPAAIASNHSLAVALLVLIATPMKNPTIAVSDERKLNIRAVNQCIPDFTSIPKSATRVRREE